MLAIPFFPSVSTKFSTFKLSFLPIVICLFGYFFLILRSLFRSLSNHFHFALVVFCSLQQSLMTQSLYVWDLQVWAYSMCSCLSFKCCVVSLPVYVIFSTIKFKRGKARESTQCSNRFLIFCFILVFANCQGVFRIWRYTIYVDIDICVWKVFRPRKIVKCTCNFDLHT